MNASNAILSPAPPWLHVVTGGATAVSNLSKSLRESAQRDIVIALLEGKEMRTFPGVFAQFSSALRFPDYFGRNFNALYDCLADLNWLPSNGYTLILRNAPLILSNEKPADASALVGLLERVCEVWNRPVDDGEPWDRPAIPFHVVFQAPIQEMDQLRPILREAGVHPSDLQVE